MLRLTCFRVLVLTACTALAACGGGGSSSSSSAAAPASVPSTSTSGGSGTGTSATASNGYTISGVVTGIAGVSLHLSGATSAVATTDSSGNFAFPTLAAGSYSVIPNRTGYVFSPVSRAATVSGASVTDLTFEATASTSATYTLSGTVSGPAAGGVVVTLNGSNVGSAVTDSSGNYSFTGLVSGTYTVSASLKGYTFSGPLIVGVDNLDSTSNNLASAPVATNTGLAFAAVTALPEATVGTPYSNSVVKSISGGTAPYRYATDTLTAGTPPLGMIVNPSGNLTGTPSVPGQYNFSVCAIDAAGEEAPCTATSIDVVTAQTPPPLPGPTVVLGASPTTITAGGAATLSWTTQYATSCAASGGWTGAEPVAGTASVTPTGTTTYVLTCTGPGGSYHAAVLVTVESATSPSVALTASATTITSGMSTTLHWVSKNATSCVGSGGWSGAQSTSGSRNVAPASTTTYTLACTGPAGIAQASSMVTVDAGNPAPTLTLTANSSTITPGGTSTLSWSTQNATSCTASGGWSGTESVSGSKGVSPATSTTYTLSCDGSGGSISKSATVTVQSSGGGGGGASGTSWVYYNGTFDWPGDYSFVATPDYSDTSGGPLSGSHDIKVTLQSAWGGWLPYAQNWSFNSNGYTKLTFALKPTVSGQSWHVYFVKVGDVPVGIYLDVSKYGPAPVAGQWATYTVPLSDLGVLGTTIYKFCIQDQTGRSSNVWYVDNVGFEP